MIPVRFHMQVITMGTIKRAARHAKGKAKEAIAEVLGDGRLQEEAKAEQRELRMLVRKLRRLMSMAED